MPLVRIDAPQATTEQLESIGSAIHNALVEAFGIPRDDHFQVLRGTSEDHVVYDPGYLGVVRDDAIVVVQVFLRRGRTADQKKAFYRGAAAGVEAAGVEPRNLMVVLTENGLDDWSFGEGAAQYVDSDT